jgi:hypothetical protein
MKSKAGVTDKSLVSFIISIGASVSAPLQSLKLRDQCPCLLRPEMGG